MVPFPIFKYCKIGKGKNEKSLLELEKKWTWNQDRQRRIKTNYTQFLCLTSNWSLTSSCWHL